MSTDVAAKEAGHSSSLGSTLRSRLRRMADAQAEKRINNRALDAISEDGPQSSHLLSGRLSRIGGSSLRKIALLYDVNLRRDRVNPSLKDSKELRLAAQELRRSFNRMGFHSKNAVSTEALSHLLTTLEQRAQGIAAPKRTLAPITRALNEASRIVSLHGPKIPWGEAREIVMGVLGAVREVTAHPRVGLGEATHNQSLAVKCAAAGRRSFCGTRLAIVQTLESAGFEFAQRPSAQGLQKILTVIDKWRNGELSSDGMVIRGTNTEPLSTVLNSSSYSSPQYKLRAILHPLIKWSSSHFSQLPEQAVAHLQQTISGVVSLIRQITVAEAIRTLDGVTVERAASATDTVNKTQPGPASEPDLLEKRRLGPLSLFGPTIKELEWHFNGAATAVTSKEISYLAKAAKWASEVKEKHQNTSKLPTSSALWISEFDGGQGAIIPKKIENHFIALQERFQVAAESTQPGFVNPENGPWLKQHIHKHDGFLLVTQEGSLNSPLSEATPTALFVATCSQQRPSPVMKKIEEHARSYMSQLPQSATGPYPRMVCELTLSSQDASAYPRKYGEHAYGALHHQFLFNTISRFPEEERVECFATCREGSTAMNAHERMGWKKTGCTYIDEHGTKFDILHNVIFPKSTLMGYRDLS